VILFLVRVRCTVQIQTVIVVCSLHGAELYSYWCVYSAHCKVRQCLVCVCVQCTVQSGTLFVVFTVRSEICNCY